MLNKYELMAIQEINKVSKELEKEIEETKKLLSQIQAKNFYDRNIRRKTLNAFLVIDKELNKIEKLKRDLNSVVF